MMKKLLVTFLTVSVFAVFTVSAQSVIVNSPSNIAGTYAFEAAGFGASLAGMTWTADAAFVDDATGTTTDGCETLVNGADLVGKIALIDRGGCEFGLKCLQAEQEGAIAAIVFNNQPGAGAIVMGAGVNGGDVTIPCVMLSLEDGQIIRDELMNGAVNITIGEVVFADNIGTGRTAILNPVNGTYPMVQAEVNPQTFTPGANVTNLGTNEATNVEVNTTIDYTPFGGSASNVYDETATVASIESDSTELVLQSTDYTAAEGMGIYSMNYNVSSDAMDESLFDNQVSSSFAISENVYSKASWDVDNSRPALTTSFTIAGGGDIEFMSGFEMPVGAGYRMDSITLRVSTGEFSFGVLEGTVSALVYEWDDVNADDVAETAELSVVALTQVDFPDTAATDAWLTVPVLDFPDFEEGYEIPGDDKRYFVGVRYDNSPGGELVFFGFDENFDQTIFVDGGFLESDIDLPYIGINAWSNVIPDVDNGFLFTGNRGSSNVALWVNPIPSAVEDIEAVTTFDAFPNPTTDALTVQVEFNETQAFVQYDIRDVMGRIVSSNRIDNVGTFNQTTLDVTDLAAGQYYLVVKTENGSQGHGFSVQR